MDRQLFKMILQQLQKTQPHLPVRGTYTDQQIVAIYYFTVLNNRPVCWACNRDHWPITYLAQWKTLPSQSQMSRRLRTPTVCKLMDQIEQQVLRPQDTKKESASIEMVWYVDGKPLPISGHSRDRQCGYGKAAGCLARGYKLHLLWGCRGTVADFRVTPMNRDERPMARRMLRNAQIQGYVIGDGNYDDDSLHKICEQRGNLRMITPPRNKKAKGFGHHKISLSRRDCMLRQKEPSPEFIKGLIKQRIQIEGFFSQQTCSGEGLWSLPPWVRTHARVHRWVQAKLVITTLRRQIQIVKKVA